MLDLSTAELVLCGLAAVAGAAIQGAIGFGYALGAYVLTLVGPSFAAAAAGALLLAAAGAFALLRGLL